MDSYQIIDLTSGVPDISIAMITYNHEKFIAQSIESVLMQKTSYTYKMIIAEDKSTDETRKLLLDYQKRYPDRIKLILQNKNVGARENNVVLLSNLEGKYVAALECDDYWTDPFKLQKQIDFLEENQNFVLCGHLVDKLNFNVKIEISEILSQPLSFTQADLFKNHIPTLSAVFRNKFNKIPEELSISPSGDFIIWSFLGQFGDFYLMNEKMAVYREHQGGTWSGVSLVKKIKNSVITRQLALSFVKDNRETIIFNAKLSKSGAYQSLKNYDIVNFLFFTKQYLKNVFQIKTII
ncbi:glycosyltransferase [Chryseobacterium sp. PBS4-4]|uniref:Glycosyltransferase n=1 Tax=Chryseobacterium edaphi TaxID=2976532 RepID=A0ABT2W938_9FLAO|nr:glycosyltransferase [Chryseobacterium edaphi]MCU7618706.1 glycosyltransferase [Chryseobacterium edaphi]